MKRRMFVASACALAVLSGSVATGAAAPDQANGPKPPKDEILVIGHRGASGYRPEHTLAAYELAIRQCADFIEPDLVSTKDGVLVARHENEISGTTDVADRPQFADRKKTKPIDGTSLTGWFTEDFTLAELKTLGAVERIPDVRPENTTFNGMFEVPTLQEVIDLARSSRTCDGNVVGIYPETKHPTYFDSIGLSLEEPLVETLHANGYRGPRAAVFIQSFEVSNLQELDRMTQLPLVQLFGGGSSQPFDFEESGDERTYTDLASPDGLAFVAGYADGIGPSKGRVIPVVGGELGEPTSLVTDAHAEGLLVHPYTFRRENTFLPEEFQIGDDPIDPNAAGDLVSEIQAFLDAGIDGFFTDNPDIGHEAVEAHTEP